MVTLLELKKMKDTELEDELTAASLDLFKLRFAVSSRQSKETHKLKALRKYIARIKTIKRMHKMERVSENQKSAVTK